jgi:hypothetical protein
LLARALLIKGAVEAIIMSISGTRLDTAQLVAVRVEKLAQDQAKREGTQVVQLIEQAAPPIGPNGEGSHINTYA